MVNAQEMMEQFAEQDRRIEALRKDRDEWRKKYRDLAIVDDREALQKENAELREEGTREYNKLWEALKKSEAERDELREELIAWEKGADFAHQHRRKKLRAARKSKRHLKRKLDKVRAERDTLNTYLTEACEDRDRIAAERDALKEKLNADR
jgi:chromosome segregation ATPase